jgi:hypothetical protein
MIICLILDALLQVKYEKSMFPMDLLMTMHLTPSCHSLAILSLRLLKRTDPVLEAPTLGGVWGRIIEASSH